MFTHPDVINCVWNIANFRFDTYHKLIMKTMYECWCGFNLKATPALIHKYMHSGKSYTYIDI